MPSQLVYGARPWYAVLGLSALALGFLGLLFFWLIPLGLLLSAAGFVVGIAGWMAYLVRHGRQPGLVILGTILSLVALVVTVLVARGSLL